MESRRAFENRELTSAVRSWYGLCPKRDRNDLFARQQGAKMKKSKILVVDDDNNLAMLIQQRLEIEGYRVKRANSAPEGYSAFLDYESDLVLTDIAMGDENGFDLIKAIRKHKPSIKAIYMTGDLNRYRSEIEDERRLYHVGLLEKPFKGSDLAELISKYASREQQKAA
jgi:DNA-binding NtrC family response regulator